ncbi:uncharacterized protein LOC131168029 isoform X2 [Malania oleifera]|uniref:uncharacterized protein LOC131168029 isoform X2 n=1 Tax=Malania oleifera TaxID=397392 RepID=UPI0025AE864B|nr:uncharacterized protein LOC131168029 isoform X2 [Malania oleifera]XP_057983165.1 uncharacterized protein LOC131168029 isoform X2 [Malania oleifera]XP_057983166.1 uncharacterized protein LOC131168029 isoform X2 [Malania oleifera]
MDLNLQSPSSGNADAKTAFHKPSNDAANRKYRRRSPVSGSSSDGSPRREHSSSPILSRDDSRAFDYRKRRKDEGRDLDRESGRSQYSRSDDFYRHSDRRSSRSSHGYSKHDDYVRHEKHLDEEDRDYQRSSRSGREPRSSSHSDSSRQESEHNRSREYSRNADKYFRDKHDVAGYRSKDKERGRRRSNPSYEENRSGERDRLSRDGNVRDERRDYRWSSGDYRNDRMPSHEEYNKGHRNDSARDTGGHRQKEAYKSDLKEFDGQKHSKEDKKKYNDWESNRDNDHCDKEMEQYENKTIYIGENQESLAKKPKLFSLDKCTDYVKSSPSVGDERQSSSVKQSQEIFSKITSEQGLANSSEATNDLNAAKFAALKAAELVNKNLTGVGCMSTEQKKKLLWGNKKNTPVEESGHHWDTTLFSDRERQEKFKKLMSLRLPWCLWPIVGCEGRVESGAQPQAARWWRPAPSREGEGTPAGSREAIHCWTPTKRWSHCWSWSLGIFTGSYCTCTAMFCDILLYTRVIISFLMIIYLMQTTQ